MNPRTGGLILVDQLAIQGVERIFGVPGESYLAVLDALYDAPIPFVICRQEGGAAMMAEADGKLTGRPGIAFVTRGPGATNASAGIHVAEQDATPMILFVGQIERGFRHRGAFQEVDYAAAFTPLAKWAVEIDDAARIPELVARAFRVAMQGRPGPVVIGLPEDMLVEMATVADAPRVEPAESWPALADMARLQKRLWAAERPLVLIGGSRWNEAAVAATARFAERFRLPVAVTFRRQMLFPADHPSYAGELGLGPNPALVERVREADLLLVVGDELSEASTLSYSLFGIPNPAQDLVHVLPDPDRLGRIYQPALAIAAALAAFAAALEGLQPPNDLRWTERTAAAHADYEAWTDHVPPHPGAVQMSGVMAALRDALPVDAIVTNGAGNYAIWPNRVLRWRRFGTQLGPTCGSMGYGVPAAIAAKLRSPERTVVAFAGDGCFLMTGQEMATAAQYGAAIVVVVVDNGMYGTIRMHQEREYPGRVSGTTLENPDFAALGRAYGGFGATVTRTEEFAPARAAAIAAGRPALIHLKMDPQAITPARTIDQIRAAAKG